MIDVERSQPPPASLTAGQWRTPEVLRRLYDDFLRKCYLCETPFRGPSECEVDHRHQRGDGGATHDWNNLFPVCDGCNKRRPKKWPVGGLLDPAGADRVEARVSQRVAWNDDGERVPVFGATDSADVAARNTALELRHIHTPSGGDTAANMKAADLRDVIIRRLEPIQELVLEYQRLKASRRPSSTRRDELTQLEQRIRTKLGRDQPYAGVIRGTLRRYLPAEILS